MAHRHVAPRVGWTGTTHAPRVRQRWRVGSPRPLDGAACCGNTIVGPFKSFATRAATTRTGHARECACHGAWHPPVSWVPAKSWKAERSASPSGVRGSRRRGTGLFVERRSHGGPGSQVPPACRHHQRGYRCRTPTKTPAATCLARRTRRQPCRPHRPASTLPHTDCRRPPTSRKTRSRRCRPGPGRPGAGSRPSCPPPMQPRCSILPMRPPLRQPHPRRPVPPPGAGLPGSRPSTP